MKADLKATYPKGDGIECLWLLQDWREEGEEARVQTRSIAFARTAIGLNLTPPVHAVVVGEREYRSGPDVSRVWMVLAETAPGRGEDMLLRDFVSQLIELKDTYHCRYLFTPPGPAEDIDHLKRAEGLTHYPYGLLDQEASAKWPSYVDSELRVGLVPRELPEETWIQAEVDRWLAEDVMDPETGRPMVGYDNEPVPKLLFFDDFPTNATQQSVRIGSGTPEGALWLALKGLERSQRRVEFDRDPEAGNIHRRPPEAEPASPTGY